MQMQKMPISETDTLAKAMAKIETEVREGVSHGHFDLAISCKIGTSGKRELLVKAGKNHRFLIPEQELKKPA
jgi:hypothetical protein